VPGAACVLASEAQFADGTVLAELNEYSTTKPKIQQKTY